MSAIKNEDLGSPMDGFSPGRNFNKIGVVMVYFFSPGGACTAGGSRNGVGEWVSE